MIVNGPVSLSEAVRVLSAKNIMPTSLDTTGLRQLDASLRRQSLFSAQTTYEYLLEKYRDFLGSLLQPVGASGAAAVGTLERGKESQAYARLGIKDFLQSVGYVPAADERGTIKDLSSDSRIDLVIDTNEQLAQGQGWWLQGQDADILDAFPAQELYRAEGRQVPRDWMARFRLAGEQTGDPIGTGWTITDKGRMIGLKNHAIWSLLGSSNLFDDGLDNPWAPFAFNSGMDVADVDRADAENLGLIEAGEKIEPMGLEEVAA